jgi:hypothetical protein
VSGAKHAIARAAATIERIVVPLMFDVVIVAQETRVRAGV